MYISSPSWIIQAVLLHCTFFWPVIKLLTKIDFVMFAECVLDLECEQKWRCCSKASCHDRATGSTEKTGKSRLHSFVGCKDWEMWSLVAVSCSVCPRFLNWCTTQPVQSGCAKGIPPPSTAAQWITTYGVRWRGIMWLSHLKSGWLSSRDCRSARAPFIYYPFVIGSEKRDHFTLNIPTFEAMHN